MTLHYNRSSEKSNRRVLRKNQTRAEKILWRCLRNRRLAGCKFRRQYSIDKFIVDFYCAELKLAIELDGVVHDEPEQKEYDIQRQEYLERFGIKFLRIKNEELFGNRNMAFDMIERFIKEMRE
jgi:very-short-patch-repair endonuclease